MRWTSELSCQLRINPVTTRSPRLAIDHHHHHLSRYDSGVGLPRRYARGGNTRSSAFHSYSCAFHPVLPSAAHNLLPPVRCCDHLSVGAPPVLTLPSLAIFVPVTYNCPVFNSCRHLVAIRGEERKTIHQQSNSWPLFVGFVVVRACLCC